MQKIIIADTLAKLFGREKPLKLREYIGIYTSASNTDALRILDEVRASLIIADYDLDDNEIERLCEGIRRENGDGKVSVLFMGSDDTMDTVHFTACGAYQYMPKSAPPEKLFRKVLQMLRIHEKKDMRSPIKISVKSSFMNEYFICKTLNISPRGLMIETGKALEKGSVIACSFSLGGPGSISADCKVTRVEKSGKGMKRYGLRFQNLGIADRKAIEDYIASEHAGVCV